MGSCFARETIRKNAISASHSSPRSSSPRPLLILIIMKMPQPLLLRTAFYLAGQKQSVAYIVVARSPLSIMSRNAAYPNKQAKTRGSSLAKPFPLSACATLESARLG